MMGCTIVKKQCYISFYKDWMCPAFLYNFKSYKVIIQWGFFTIFIVIIFLIAFNKVGGVEALWDEFGKLIVPVVNMTNMTSNNTMGTMSSHSNTTSSCYSMTPYWSNMFRPASDIQSTHGLDCGLPCPLLASGTGVQIR